MRPGTKKLIANSCEGLLFVAFAFCGIVLGDDIRRLYQSRFSSPVTFPWYVWLWPAIGISLTITRLQAGRYARAEALDILSAPSFIENYRETLRNSIDTLVAILRDAANYELLDSAETAVLKAINVTADRFRNATARRKADVNCVLMEPKLYDPNADANRTILGLEPNGREHLQYLLTITKMANQQLEIPLDFALPVYNLNGALREKIPLGAPKAFATATNQVINFTLWLRPHRGHSSKTVVKDLRKYFWHHKRDFLSFASLPIRSGNRVVAVVTIHCKWIRVLGKHRTMLIDFLVPFLTILSYIHERKEEVGP